jgi:hypothetical protein
VQDGGLHINKQTNKQTNEHTHTHTTKATHHRRKDFLCKGHKFMSAMKPQLIEIKWPETRFLCNSARLTDITICLYAYICNIYIDRIHTLFHKEMYLPTQTTLLPPLFLNRKSNTYLANTRNMLGSYRNYELHEYPSLPKCFTVSNGKQFPTNIRRRFETSLTANQ